jgi:hypothetical protein
LNSTGAAIRFAAPVFIWSYRVDELKDKISITYAGQQRELFMSFLRLNSCIRVLGGDVNNIAMMMVDPDMGENILRVLLAPDGGAGAMFDFTLNENEIGPEDVDTILLWAQDHLTAFFVKRFQQAQASAKKLEPMIVAQESQLDGSPA